MQVTILGGGAIGSLFATLLSEHGVEATIVSRRAEHVELVRKRGITVLENGERRTAKVNVSSLISTEKPDAVIVAVKSYDIEAVVKPACLQVNSDTVFLTLQNGLNNTEKIASIVGENRVIGGVTRLGCTVLNSGEIFYAGKGRTIIGSLTPEGRNKTEKIANVFNSSGLDTIISDEINQEIWAKVLVSAAINPLTALTQLNNAQLLRFPQIREIMAAAVREGVEVAEKVGIRFDADLVEESIEIARQTGVNKSSMLQDVERRTRTEIDAINGEIMRLGAKYNVSTPVNSLLTNLIKGLEDSFTN